MLLGFLFSFQSSRNDSNTNHVFVCVCVPSIPGVSPEERNYIQMVQLKLFNDMTMVIGVDSRGVLIHPNISGRWF